MRNKFEKKYSISDELKERTYKFAIGIFELASMLPNTEEGRVIRRQSCKSGTSVGSNLEEADGSLTLNDFIYKVDPVGYYRSRISSKIQQGYPAGWILHLKKVKKRDIGCI